MEPKIIQLSTNGALYANNALIKFIRETIAGAGNVIDNDECIFFMKNVDFKRDWLQLSAKSLKRTILPEKATAIIINSDFKFPVNPLGLKGNLISNNIPEWEADDIVYNISSLGVNQMEIFVQWFEISKLKNKPKFVVNTCLAEQINNGVVINADMLDQLIDMFDYNKPVATKTIDHCDLNASLPYILYLVHFCKVGDFLKHSEGLAKTYLLQKNMLYNLPKAGLDIMMADTFIANKIVAQILPQIKEAAVNARISAPVKACIADINVDIVWK